MPGHLPVDVIKYNAIAETVMKENGIAIDDLYATVLPQLDELQLPANVHFKGVGCDVLAAQVKTAIAAALDSQKAK
jgi:acyl-CoA thioesterase-1